MLDEFSVEPVLKIIPDGKFVNLKGNDSCQVRENDLFIMETPGGGGFGSQ